MKVQKTEKAAFRFNFAQPLVEGVILDRYKRFLADIRLENGDLVTAHVANSGSMKTCWQPEAPAILTVEPPDSKRKLKYTLQAVKMPDGWVGVNTLNPNRAVFQAISTGKIEELSGYRYIQSESKTTTGSRFDLALFSDYEDAALNEVSLNPKRVGQIEEVCDSGLSPCLIEIKNATLKEGDGVIFPDAKTERGQKHLLHLIEMKQKGFRSIILFFAGRNEAKWVGPARLIDPRYAELLEQAVAKGVEAIGLQVKVSRHGLDIVGTIPVKL